MGLYSKKGLIERIRRGKRARAKLVSSNLDKGIAFQIRATRDRQKLTQAGLATAVGMTQNNISRLEDETYGKHTLSSLKRIAEALDVALVVRFVPFSQYIDWLSATPFLDEGIRPEALAVPSFEDEEEARQFETSVKYFPVYYPKIAASVTGATQFTSVGVSGLYSPDISHEVTNVPVSGVYESELERKAS